MFVGILRGFIMTLKGERLELLIGFGWVRTDGLERTMA